MKQWMFGKLADLSMRYILLGLLGIFLVAVLIGMVVEWYIGRGER